MGFGGAALLVSLGLQCSSDVARLEFHLAAPALMSLKMLLQVIAYNKIDLPDSGDYIDEVREFLLGNGLAEEDVHAISAVTGQGVQGIVRRAREVLDQLPQEVSRALLRACPCEPLVTLACRAMALKV